MMNYEIFKEVVKEKFMDYMPEKFKGMELVAEPVEKVNVTLDGIILREEGRNISPTIYINDMQKLQEVLVKRLSENTVSDYLQTTNMDFLDMFLTAKHLEGCSDKTIRYYRCNIEKMLDTINIRS